MTRIVSTGREINKLSREIRDAIELLSAQQASAVSQLASLPPGDYKVYIGLDGEVKVEAKPFVPEE